MSPSWISWLRSSRLDPMFDDPSVGDPVDVNCWASNVLPVGLNPMNSPVVGHSRSHEDAPNWPVPRFARHPPYTSTHQPPKKRGELCRYRPSFRQPGPDFIRAS